MDSFTLENIIVETAEKSIEYIDEEKGSFIPGINGPHGHQETPVRNTAHWLITNLKAYEITKNKKFKNASKKALNYLMLEELRPQGYTFLQRGKGGTDKCNGVIGQAWVIEALIKASKILKNEDAKTLAIESFLLLPFDKRIGLWKRREIDGKTNKGFDLTLNHQIWFAAAGSYLIEYNQTIKEQVNRFLHCLKGNIDLNENGCFKMAVNTNHLLKKGYLLNAVRTSELYKNIRKVKKRGKEVDIGYHAFHMYGLAMLKENFPKHEIWKSAKISGAINFMLSEEYKEEVMVSKYGIGYNPPGFEVAYSLSVFADVMSSIENIDKNALWWIEQQIKTTYNFKDKMMNLVEDDPITYSARAYEATRIPYEYLVMPIGLKRTK